MNFDIDEMLATHGAWKRRLRAAINAREELDAETIGRHDCCALGQWLHSEEAKQKYGHLAAYRECGGAHGLFHREAGKVAQLVNRRRYAEAESALRAATPYDAASSRLMAAIGNFWRDAVAEKEATGV